MSDLSPLALVESPLFPPTHWRVMRPYIRLRQNGIEAKVSWQEHQQIGTSPSETVLVLPQMTGPDIETAREWLDARRGKVAAIVYETDDDIFTAAQTEHLLAADWMQGKTPDQLAREQEVARWFVDQCDGITVSSDRLAEIVRSFSSTPVHVVPNALDVRWFRAHMVYRPAWADTLTIGWAGGRRAERDLVPMARAWGKIAARYPDVKFVICTPTTPTVLYRYVPESRFIRLPWLGLDDYPMAHQVDIGCCSVKDNAFNRCRTPIKAWEYAIAGAAVVTQGEIYANQPHTFRVDNTEGWEGELSSLIERSLDRRYQQQQASLAVEADHNLDTELHRWMDAYGAIVDAKNGVIAS